MPDPRVVQWAESVNLPSAFVAPDVIIKYFKEGDAGFEKLLKKADQRKIRLVISDFALYEAISSLDPGELDYSKLVRILWTLEIISSPKLKMTNPRRFELRRRSES